MTGFKTSKSTSLRWHRRVIASGILSLWVGLAVADEAGPEFGRWTMPGASESTHREPASSLSTERKPDTENRETITLVRHPAKSATPAMA